MIKRITQILILTVIVFGWNGKIWAQKDACIKSQKGFENLLSDIYIINGESAKQSLITLFSKDESSLEKVSEYWNSSESSQSIGAQRIVRYTGYPKILKKWERWCIGKSGCLASGAIPIPLTQLDKQVILYKLENEEICNWGYTDMGYIYALLLDKSKASQNLLQKIKSKTNYCLDDSIIKTGFKNAEKANPREIILDSKNLTDAVLDNLFFLNKRDLKNKTVSFWAFNNKKDKALLEVYVNHGILAERFYHIVLKKTNKGWRYFSITLVALS